jgi:hypothetical protein
MAADNTTKALTLMPKTRAEVSKLMEEAAALLMQAIAWFEPESPVTGK